jgi:CBS domain-containing protein
MSRLKVRDVMTHNVIAVRADASFKTVAQLMAANTVSALPVLDERGRLIGIVSEADLLPKEEHRGRPARHRRPLTPARRHDEAKASGAVVRDLMSWPAVTIDADAALAEAARTMIAQRVKRLPVVTDSDRLVGIVSRIDLLGAFLRPDDEIAAEVERDMAHRVLLTEAGQIEVRVADGVVTLSGHVDRRTSHELAEKLAREVDGVVGVDNQLTHRWDDTKLAR